MTEPRRILLVEDDPSIAAGLAMNLRFEGYQVEIAVDGESGLGRTLEWRPHLVILDVMLPGMNGYEVCHAIRRSDADTAVLMLSAKGSEVDKVLGLDVGADDYVTKPFGLNELLARINAVLRRRRQSSATIKFSDVVIDIDAHRVTRAGAPLDLTARELRLLEYLALHPGQVLSRQQLLDAAWGVDYDGSERTVDNFVRRLRVKLEPDPDAPRHLITVVGLGYRFEP